MVNYVLQTFKLKIN